MSKEELKKFAKGFTFLTFNFIYTITVLLIDYGFWRLLSFMTLSLSLQNQSNSLIKDLINKGISSVGSASGLGEQTQNVMKDMVGIVAQGSGFMAIIYRYNLFFLVVRRSLAVSNAFERVINKHRWV